MASPDMIWNIVRDTSSYAVALMAITFPASGLLLVGANVLAWTPPAEEAEQAVLL